MFFKKNIRGLKRPSKMQNEGQTGICCNLISEMLNGATDKFGQISSSQNEMSLPHCLFPILFNLLSISCIITEEQGVVYFVNLSSSR